MEKARRISIGRMESAAQHHGKPFAIDGDFFREESK